jgi:threonine/homoserine/homoserine lactone efflux protein
MDMALYLSLAGFVVVMSITPGPNNLMMMSSSALFGVRRTLPHWLGVQFGFNVMLVAAVFGLGGLVARYPWTLDAVKIGGSLWLAWMALAFFRAGLARPAEAGEGKKTAPRRARPFRTYEAALFQWVNPKAFLMTVSAAGAYIALADTAGERAVLFVVTFLLLGAPCGLLWVMAGGVIHRFLTDRRHARILNMAIGVLLLATVAIILNG